MDRINITWASGQPLKELEGIVLASMKKGVLGILLYKDGLKIDEAFFSTVAGNVVASIERANKRIELLLRKHNLDNIQEHKIDTCSLQLSISDKFQLLYRRLITKLVSILFYESWMIGVVEQPIESSPNWSNLSDVKWVDKRRKMGYLADPFSVPLNGNIVYCEEFNYKKHLGRLVEFKISENGVIQDKKELQLNINSHLSFPFTFSHNEEWYILPESSAANVLQLFRLNEKFEPVLYSTIMEGITAADSIIFYHNGLFWLMYTDISINAYDNVNLLYSTSLDGVWHKHKKNPVKLDPCSSRCAGTPFIRDGKLHRPAQDCSKTYGGAIKIMEIIECTTEEFKEREVNTIHSKSKKNRYGLHTIARYGDKCLIDAKSYMFSCSHIVRKIANRWMT